MRRFRMWLSGVLAPPAEGIADWSPEGIERLKASLPPADFRNEVLGAPFDPGPLVGDSAWIVRGSRVLPCEVRGHADSGFDVYVPHRGSLWTRTIYGSYDAAFEQAVLQTVLRGLKEEGAPKGPHLRLVGDDE